LRGNITTQPFTATWITELPEEGRSHARGIYPTAGFAAARLDRPGADRCFLDSELDADRAANTLGLLSPVARVLPAGRLAGVRSPGHLAPDPQLEAVYWTVPGLRDRKRVV